MLTYRYDNCIADILLQYAVHEAYPLQELELYTGRLLGKTTGKRAKENLSALKERFECDYAYFRDYITIGDESVGDGGKLEALPRSIACLQVALQEEGQFYPKSGILKGFAYVAAGICFRELDNFLFAAGSQLDDFT